jgi:hypothetical protein
VSNDLFLLRIAVLISESPKSRAEEHGADKGADTSQQVDRAASGEIYVSEVVQPADIGPNPVRYRWIHNS